MNTTILLLLVDTANNPFGIATMLVLVDITTIGTGTMLVDITIDAKCNREE